MVFSKRERYVAIGVVAVLALLLLDSFIITPYFARRDAIDREFEQATDDLHKTESLFKEQKKLRKVLAELNAGGLGTNESDAESQLQTALSDWSAESGVNVSSLKWERTSPEGKFKQISFHLTGTGALSNMAKLLWAVETTTMPLRVNEIQLNPRKEGFDDLQLQLAVSTLSRIPDSEKPNLRTASAARGEGQ